MLRKFKWKIPGQRIAGHYNWCQGPVPGRGPAVEEHCCRASEGMDTTAATLVRFYHKRLADRACLRTAWGRRIVRLRHKSSLRAVNEHVAACILWRCSSMCGLHNGGSTNCSPLYVSRHTTSKAAIDAVIYRASEYLH